MTNYREEYEVVGTSSGRTNNNRWLTDVGSEVVTTGHHVKHEVDLVDGLISYWPMYDNDSNTMVVDIHGSNNATCSTNTSVISSEGRIERSMYFDGSNNYVDISSLESTPGEYINANKPFTFSFWVNFKTLSGFKGIISSSLNANFAGFNISHNGALLYITVNEDISNNYRYSSYGNELVVDTWYHMVCVHNGEHSEDRTQKWSFYINDRKIPLKFVLDNPAGGTLSDFATTPLRVGYLDTYTTYDFDGYISDIGFWSRDLDLFESSVLYNEGKGLSYEYFKQSKVEGIKSGVIDNVVPEYGSNIESNMLAYCKFDDDEASTVVVDSTGNGDGVLNTNSSTIALPYGINGHAFDFSISNHFIDLDRLKTYIGQGLMFSVSLWFYGSTSRTLFGNTNTSATSGLGVYVTGSGALSAFAATSSGNYRTLVSSETLYTGWNHCVLTYDGNSDSNGWLTGARLYVNGVDNNTTLAGGTQTSFTPANFFIGRLSGTYDNGTMADFSFWDITLSQSNTDLLYNNGKGRFYGEFGTGNVNYGLPDVSKGLKAFYPMNDNNSSTDVSDYTGNFNGTCTNATSTISEPGYLDESLTLGVTDYITLPIENNTAGRYLDIRKPFTFSFWVTGDMYTSYYNFPVSTLNSSTRGLLVYQNTTDDLVVRFYESSGVNESITTTATLPVDNLFHHVAVTYDGKNIANGTGIYFDGAKMDTTYVNTSGPVENFSTDVDIYIGLRSSDSTASNTDSEYSDFGFWSRELGNGEIRYLYNNGYGRRPEDIVRVNDTNNENSRLVYDKIKSDLVSYYKMNDDIVSESTTCTDYSGNALNGTYASETPTCLTTDSNTLLALNCDGTVDNIMTTTVESYQGQVFSIDKPFSVSMWTKGIASSTTARILFANTVSGPIGITVLVYNGRTEFILDGANGNFKYIENVYSLTDLDRWYNVVVTYDGQGATSGNTGADSMKIYIDGRYSLYASGGSGRYDEFSTSSNMIIGSAPVDRVPTYLPTYAPVTEVMIWSRQLSDHEIALVHNYGAPFNFQVSDNIYYPRMSGDHFNTSVIDTVSTYDGFTPDSERGRNTDVFVNRFNGTTDINGAVGYLDKEALEKTPYSATPWRNLKVRKQLDDEWR